jgi:uncharacterized protein
MSQEKNTEPKFEMQTYYFVFLNAGANRSQTNEEAQKIQNEHLAHLNSLFESGKLKLAGPFLDDSEMRGILILDVKSEEEARELTDKDPAVIAGRLTAVIKPWFGPKNLKVEPDK